MPTRPSRPPPPPEPIGRDPHARIVVAACADVLARLAAMAATIDGVCLDASGRWLPDTRQTVRAAVRRLAELSAGVRAVHAELTDPTADLPDRPQPVPTPKETTMSESATCQTATPCPVPTIGRLVYFFPESTMLPDVPRPAVVCSVTDDDTEATTVGLFVFDIYSGLAVETGVRFYAAGAGPLDTRRAEWMPAQHAIHSERAFLQARMKDGAELDAMADAAKLAANKPSLN